jgi:hypothetical protein
MADALTTAINELKAELKSPDTIHKAVKQYIIARIVDKLVNFDQGGADDDHPSMALSIKISNPTDTADDEGASTHCEDSEYTAFGVSVWTSHHCETVTTEGTGTILYEF